jgi:hypothetical protein
MEVMVDFPRWNMQIADSFWSKSFVVSCDKSDGRRMIRSIQFQIVEKGGLVDSGSECATINVTSVLDGSYYLLWFDLKYDKIFTTVSEIVSIGSRNWINGDDVVGSDVIIGHVDCWAGMNID